MNIGQGLASLGVAAAVITAVYVTGSAVPLLGLLALICIW